MRLVVESIQSGLNEISETIRKERDYLYQRKPDFEDIAEKSDRNVERDDFERKIKEIRLDNEDLKKIIAFCGESDSELGLSDLGMTTVIGLLENEYGETLKQINSAAETLEQISGKC